MEPNPTATEGPRVVVVADDPLARHGLALMLDALGVRVVAQSAGGELAVAAIHDARADVALVDLGVDPGAAADRLDAVAALEGVAVIALAPDEASGHDALASGARAVLAREASGRAIVAALAAVAEGLFVTDAAVLPRSASVRPRTVRGTDELTAREREVLQLLATGLANKTIAQRLGISDHTVKFHVNAILAKLGAQSRTEAVVSAARLGLVIL